MADEKWGFVREKDGRKGNGQHRQEEKRERNQERQMVGISRKEEKDMLEIPQKQSVLPRTFFTRDGITVAKELLGKILVHETRLGTVRGIITEVESYMGEEDKGSHTYGGKRTERTEPMYHVGGTSYVYLIYGMYSCMNIAAMTEDIPQAVLIRSVIPADSRSEERMMKLRLAAAERKGKKGNPDLIRKHLADGPGKLCLAMGITKADNCIDMTESKSFYVTEGITIQPSEICLGKRIGIDYAEEAADYLWRFFVKTREVRK